MLTDSSTSPRATCARRAEAEALCATLRGYPEPTFRLVRLIRVHSRFPVFNCDRVRAALYSSRSTTPWRWTRFVECRSMNGRG